MKPILFAKGETDFTTNGLGRLDCISCKVIEERNGMFELEAEIPVSSPHAMEVEYLSIIGAKAHDGGNIQAFTVYKITKPMNGRFMVYARHLSYRLSDIPCSPFTVAASPQAAANTLAGLKNNALEPCPFNFSTDVTTGNPYTQNVPASIRQRLGGVEGSVLDQFGGEFEFDNWNVKLWKSRGRLSNVTGISLRYGKNITDINQEEEIASTVTGVVPYWIDTDGNNLVTLPEHVVYADNAANYPYHITQVLDLSSEFEEKPTVTQLRGVANAYVHKDGFGVPKVSIKVSFRNLWESEEYKDIAPLERVQLCDEVSVYFEKLGISSIAKVVKTDFDVLKERYNNVEVGSLRTTLAQAVTDRDKDIDTTFIQEMTRVSTAITNATAWLTNANGYVVAVKNQDGSWKELLFMNTNDPQTATQGIRFNNNGIGFWNKATDGGNVLDGPYGTAWTIDGRLGDFADKNFWNIRTGDFSLSASATVGGQTVQQIADAAQAAAEATASAALATAVLSIDGDIADLQNQIDGNITTWYYDYVPTLNNVPASTWTTDEDKNNHIGDLFYQDSTGYAWRFMLDNSVTPAVYKWIRISDEDIAAALAAAQNAQYTADKKRRVFVTTPVPPYDIGDLWCVGPTGDILTCVTAKTTGQAYAAADWVKKNKYTDDSAVTALNNALTQEEIFNRLTNNGQTMGIYLDATDNKLYINATFIKSGKMSASIIEGDTLTLGGANNANGQLVVNNASGIAVFTADNEGINAIKGDIGDLTLQNGELYDIGDFIIRQGERYVDTTSRGMEFSNSFTPSKLGLKAASFNVSVKFTTTKTIENGYVSLELAHWENGGWVNKDTDIIRNIIANEERTKTFNTTIYSNDNLPWRIVFYISSESGYTIDYTIYSSNKRTVSISNEGLYGTHIGSHIGTGDFDSVDVNRVHIIDIESDDYVSSDGTNIIRYDSLNRTTYQARWQSSSDERVKENITDLDADLSLNLIDATQPKRFKFKNIDGIHYGMIAQETRELLDNLGESESRLEFSLGNLNVKDQRAIEYEEYIPHLINYVKDLRAIVDRQQAEIDQLKEIVKKLSM